MTLTPTLSTTFSAPQSALRDLLSSATLGTPITQEGLTTIPLLYAGNASTARYTTLPEALKSGTAVVTEVSEGGSVPTLALDNRGALPILIVDGEELIGAKQNRIVNLTILAPPKRQLPIPVSCVEQGRWSYRSQHFTDSPRAMTAAARARKTSDVSRSMRQSGERHADQGAVWNDVQHYSFMLGVESPTMAMADLYTQHSGSIEEYVNAFSAAPEQIGALFSIGDTVVGLDLFDHPNTLRTYLPKLVRSYAVDALVFRRHGRKPRNASTASPERFLEEVANAPTGRFQAIGLGEDIRIDGERITGGALEYEGRVVHLSVFRTGDDGSAGFPDTTPPRGGR